MAKRRDLLKLGLVVGGASLLASKRAQAQDRDLLKYLCPPDGFPDQLAKPSPPAQPFVADLFIPPIALPVDQLTPPPDPHSHQRYDEFKPKKFYAIHEREFLWKYHTQPPYDKGSWSWGFWAKNSRNIEQGMAPGPTYHARYEEPILVRRYNDLPPVGASRVTFALPSTSSHLHNGHTASESDGHPLDWIDAGEFWDHHYGNFPLENNELEKLTTLWYHDHRLDFTAANVAAGLSGFYLLFDERDTGYETLEDNRKLFAEIYGKKYDPEKAWRLPSGPYDVPLILHDLLFAKVVDENKQETAQAVFNPFNTDGLLGDQVTVNRTIRPRLQVERRKYRFRILNGGPSRFYNVYLMKLAKDKTPQALPIRVITSDGNFVRYPIDVDSIFLSVAQRADVIIDFSEYKDGDQLVLLNLAEQTNGRGPSGQTLAPDPPTYANTGIIRFDVVGGQVADPSQVPDEFRPLPTIDMTKVRKERLWVFDYDGGLWTVNGKVSEADRIDAGVEYDTAEIWTFRNGGTSWSHPIHNHFTEFLLLEVNGRPYSPTLIDSTSPGHILGRLESGPPPAVPKGQTRYRRGVYFGGSRRDVATLRPGDEIKVFMRFTDFLGKYTMHCHNVIHEDHAMMVRWDLVWPGKEFEGPPRLVSEVYPPGTTFPDPHLPATPHLEERPGSATFQK
jgi:FtsP/CotA-like multicopper oxidase with cupredoxin domain